VCWNFWESVRNAPDLRNIGTFPYLLFLCVLRAVSRFCPVADIQYINETPMYFSRLSVCLWSSQEQPEIMMLVYLFSITRTLLQQGDSQTQEPEYSRKFELLASWNYLFLILQGSGHNTAILEYISRIDDSHN